MFGAPGGKCCVLGGPGGQCGVLGGPEPERRSRLQHGEEWLAGAKKIKIIDNLG